MRVGWSCKDAAAVLNIRPTHVSQSLDPTLDRIARLWRSDVNKTIASIMNSVDKLNELEPMDDAELALRERILSGRANRSELR